MSVVRCAARNRRGWNLAKAFSSLAHSRCRAPARWRLEKMVSPASLDVQVRKILGFVRSAWFGGLLSVILVRENAIAGVPATGSPERKQPESSRPAVINMDIQARTSVPGGCAECQSPEGRSEAEVRWRLLKSHWYSGLPGASWPGLRKAGRAGACRR